MDTHIEIVIGALKELREQVLAELPCTCTRVHQIHSLEDPNCTRHPIKQVIDEYIEQHEAKK